MQKVPVTQMCGIWQSKHLKLDLVCHKQAVSNSRPARRKDFFLFTCRTVEEIGNGNIRTKLEVYSITCFVDRPRFQNTPHFIRVTWPRPCPFCRFLFMYFGEIVHVHRCAKFEVCSYTRVRDTSEGLPNFIGARDPIKATPRYRILFVPFG